MRSSILARIPGFRQRIIPEPRVPSRGSQARGTRLDEGNLLPRTQALWFVYVRTWDGTRGRKTENSKSIKLIHAAHAKATQAIEQHIAPGYEAGKFRRQKRTSLPLIGELYLIGTTMDSI